jgi:hypothetical protein
MLGFISNLRPTWIYHPGEQPVFDTLIGKVIGTAAKYVDIVLDIAADNIGAASGRR